MLTTRTLGLCALDWPLEAEQAGGKRAEVLEGQKVSKPASDVSCLPAVTLFWRWTQLDKTQHTDKREKAGQQN